jgi:hypothetical protein
MARSNSDRPKLSDCSANLLVVSVRRGLPLGRGVGEGVAAAALRAAQVLEQIRARGLDVEAAVAAAAGRRLAQHHDVGERHPPEIVEDSVRARRVLSSASWTMYIDTPF